VGRDGQDRQRRCLDDVLCARCMVMPPGSPLLSDKEHIRQVVTQLLGQPHLSLSWHPVKVEAAASGDLAYLIGAYELHFDDAHGAPVADRARSWRFGAGNPTASWRCSVDTWNSDQAAEAPAQAAAASAAQGMSAAVAAPVPAAAPPAAEPRPPRRRRFIRPPARTVTSPSITRMRSTNTSQNIWRAGCDSL